MAQIPNSADLAKIRGLCTVVSPSGKPWRSEAKEKDAKDVGRTRGISFSVVGVSEIEKFHLLHEKDEMETKLTKYEKARLLGLRATQLANGAEPTVDPRGMYDPLKIAEKELELGTIPIKIIRTLPNGKKYQVCIRPKGQKIEKKKLF